MKYLHIWFSWTLSFNFKIIQKLFYLFCGGVDLHKTTLPKSWFLFIFFEKSRASINSATACDNNKNNILIGLISCWQFSESINMTPHTSWNTYRIIHKLSLGVKSIIIYHKLDWLVFWMIVTKMHGNYSDLVVAVSIPLVNWCFAQQLV